MPQSAFGAWDRMISLATLGLARHSPNVGELLPDPALRLPEGTPEQGMLRCAAATLLVRMAGQRSSTAALTLPAPAAGPSQRLIADSAMRRLANLSSQGPKQLIGEWFNCALQSGRVLPPQWIPPIFETLTAAMRMEYAAVFGERIHWLASLDARWTIEGMGKACSESEWMTGSATERTALLRRVRGTDPDRGRAWLTATWSTDAPEAREAFVQALKVGLSSADEPFLEQALDDKRKGVRVAAIEHLASLPGSAFMRRSLQRLTTEFVFEPRSTGLLARLSSRKLRIELPAELSKSAQRDGIEPKPPASRKIGERSFWFMQMLSIVPPREWLRRFDCTAVELLEAADRTDHAQEVFTALCAACVRHPDVEWVAALSAAWRARANEQGPDAASGVAALLAVLPAEVRDPQLRAQLTALRDQGAIDVAMHLLTTSEHAWSQATTALAFDVLLSYIRGAPDASHPVTRSLLESWGRRVDAASAGPAVRRILDKIGAESPSRGAIEHLLEVIEFRIDMHKELLE